MATKPKRTARELAARKRALERALELNAERFKREQELTDMAADFLMTRELETDVMGGLEEQIAALRAAAQAECAELRRQGAAAVAVMVARGEGAGRIAQRLGVGIGEVRQLRDDAAGRVQEVAGRGESGGGREAAGAVSGPVSGVPVAGGVRASWGGAAVAGGVGLDAV